MSLLVDPSSKVANGSIHTPEAFAAANHLKLAEPAIERWKKIKAFVTEIHPSNHAILAKYLPGKTVQNLHFLNFNQYDFILLSRYLKTKLDIERTVISGGAAQHIYGDIPYGDRDIIFYLKRDDIGKCVGYVADFFVPRMKVDFGHVPDEHLKLVILLSFFNNKVHNDDLGFSWVRLGDVELKFFLPEKYETDFIIDGLEVDWDEPKLTYGGVQDDTTAEKLAQGIEDLEQGILRLSHSKPLTPRVLLRNIQKMTQGFLSNPDLERKSFEAFAYATSPGPIFFSTVNTQIISHYNQFPDRAMGFFLLLIDQLKLNGKLNEYQSSLKFFIPCLKEICSNHALALEALNVLEQNEISDVFPLVKAGWLYHSIKNHKKLQQTLFFSKPLSVQQEGGWFFPVERCFTIDCLEIAKNPKELRDFYALVFNLNAAELGTDIKQVVISKLLEVCLPKEPFAGSAQNKLIGFEVWLENYVQLIKLNLIKESDGKEKNRPVLVEFEEFERTILDLMPLLENAQHRKVINAFISLSNESKLRWNQERIRKIISYLSVDEMKQLVSDFDKESKLPSLEWKYYLLQRLNNEEANSALFADWLECANELYQKTFINDVNIRQMQIVLHRNLDSYLSNSHCAQAILGFVVTKGLSAVIPKIINFLVFQCIDKNSPFPYANNELMKIDSELKKIENGSLYENERLAIDLIVNPKERIKDIVLRPLSQTNPPLEPPLAKLLERELLQANFSQGSSSRPSKGKHKAAAPAVSKEQVQKFLNAYFMKQKDAAIPFYIALSHDSNWKPFLNKRMISDTVFSDDYFHTGDLSVLCEVLSSLSVHDLEKILTFSHSLILLKRLEAEIEKELQRSAASQIVSELNCEQENTLQKAFLHCISQNKDANQNKDAIDLICIIFGRYKNETEILHLENETLLRLYIEEKNIPKILSFLNKCLEEKNGMLEFCRLYGSKILELLATNLDQIEDYSIVCQLMLNIEQSALVKELPKFRQKLIENSTVLFPSYFPVIIKNQAVKELLRQEFLPYIASVNAEDLSLDNLLKLAPVLLKLFSLRMSQFNDSLSHLAVSCLVNCNDQLTLAEKIELFNHISLSVKLSDPMKKGLRPLLNTLCEKDCENYFDRGYRLGVFELSDFKSLSRGEERQAYSRKLVEAASDEECRRASLNLLATRPSLISSTDILIFSQRFEKGDDEEIEKIAELFPLIIKNSSYRGWEKDLLKLWMPAIKRQQVPSEECAKILLLRLASESEPASEIINQAAEHFQTLIYPVINGDLCTAEQLTATVAYLMQSQSAKFFSDLSEVLLRKSNTQNYHLEDVTAIDINLKNICERLLELGEREHLEVIKTIYNSIDENRKEGFLFFYISYLAKTNNPELFDLIKTHWKDDCFIKTLCSDSAFEKWVECVVQMDQTSHAIPEDVFNQLLNFFLNRPSIFDQSAITIQEIIAGNNQKLPIFERLSVYYPYLLTLVMNNMRFVSDEKIVPMLRFFRRTHSVIELQKSELFELKVFNWFAQNQLAKRKVGMDYLLSFINGIEFSDRDKNYLETISQICVECIHQIASNQDEQPENEPEQTDLNGVIALYVALPLTQSKVVFECGKHLIQAMKNIIDDLDYLVNIKAVVMKLNKLIANLNVKPPEQWRVFNELATLIEMRVFPVLDPKSGSLISDPLMSNPEAPRVYLNYVIALMTIDLKIWSQMPNVRNICVHLVSELVKYDCSTNPFSYQVGYRCEVIKAIAFLNNRADFYKKTVNEAMKKSKGKTVIHNAYEDFLNDMKKNEEQFASYQRESQIQLCDHYMDRMESDPYDEEGFAKFLGVLGENGCCPELDMLRIRYLYVCGDPEIILAETGIYLFNSTDRLITPKGKETRDYKICNLNAANALLVNKQIDVIESTIDFFLRSCPDCLEDITTDIMKHVTTQFLTFHARTKGTISTKLGELLDKLDLNILHTLLVDLFSDFKKAPENLLKKDKLNAIFNFVKQIPGKSPEIIELCLELLKFGIEKMTAYEMDNPSLEFFYSKYMMQIDSLKNMGAEQWELFKTTQINF